MRLITFIVFVFCTHAKHIQLIAFNMQVKCTHANTHTMILMRVISRHTVVCHAAQEAGASHREYIDRKKTRFSHLCRSVILHPIETIFAVDVCPPGRPPHIPNLKKIAIATVGDFKKFTYGSKRTIVILL